MSRLDGDTLHVLRARRGGLVTRFHNRPLSPQENVAEHTYGVLVLVDVLSDYNPSPQLLRAALYHDVAEQVTGDIPWPTKRYSPELSDHGKVLEKSFHEDSGFPLGLDDPRDEAILKYADMIDLLFKCYESKLAGNSLLRDVFFNGLKYVRGLPEVPGVTERAMNLVNKLVSEFADEHLGDMNLYAESLVEVYRLGGLPK